MNRSALREACEASSATRSGTQSRSKSRTDHPLLLRRRTELEKESVQGFLARHTIETPNGRLIQRNSSRSNPSIPTKSELSHPGSTMCDVFAWIDFFVTL